MVNQALCEAGLLPAFSKDEDSEWARVMARPPLAIRARALGETVDRYDFGRALYHLAKRRQFAGRELDESDTSPAENADEKTAKSGREDTLRTLRTSGQTLGQMLAAKPAHERSRGVHAIRTTVIDEFERLWTAQAQHQPGLDNTLKAHIADLIFAQKPVFWRKSTLGACRLMPGEELAPKGSWLSQQRRMLEKLNNLEIASGNRRPLDDEERAAILAKLQTQASMSWSAARKALAPLYAARGEVGVEQKIRFNLELGGEAKLLGNPLEAKLAAIFGEGWADHIHKQGIREAVHRRLWSADYAEVGNRVVILSATDRAARRDGAAASLIRDFDATEAEAQALADLKLPTGWEPFSTKALQAILPRLQAGDRFGALMISPDCAAWREATFPDRDRPTGQVLDRLPSPARKKLVNGNGWDTEEQDRIKAIRNPTVARTQNELRKVVNNLIDAFGKPDLIRIELARDVGLSKREREEKQAGIRKNEKRRADARKDLEANGLLEPSPRDITKWVLWKEGRERCPYTGDPISFASLFGPANSFDIEHIWPRGRSLDDSQGNKTLCRNDVNIAKGNRTPFEFFQNRPEEWTAVKRRLDEMTAGKGSAGFPRGKVRRFVAETMPDDFAARQLVDTGYAARQAVGLLKRLWPDVGEANVAADFGIEAELRRRRVLPVNGKVTAHLRKLWGLNGILSDDGEKTRADHRHHAIDALVVACAHPGVTERLAQYWQLKDDRRAEAPALPPPWPSVRRDAERAVAAIVVSHRVRKKVSGPLHEETIRGDTGIDVREGKQTFRLVVSRKPVEALTKAMLASDEAIVDPEVRRTIRRWVADHGGDPKKAFAEYPKVKGGTPIKRVRVRERRQTRLMAPVANGWADAAGNHHVAIWRDAAGKVSSEAVSLLEASRRLSSRLPVVRRVDPRGDFVMSLVPGDTLRIADGERAGFWTVQGVWAAGPIIITRSTDATGTTVFRPTAGSLLAMGARKVSVDPIGRVRASND
ncbi:MAG: type II CRISPR RNA-guided endonuclease Cas9 [Sphingomonadaceae bacterium]|nr:type II CRISPR RNA-guided endonuclease Cas9 [Sphingomonadaceae bacterium]